MKVEQKLVEKKKTQTHFTLSSRGNHLETSVIWDGISLPLLSTSLILSGEDNAPIGNGTPTVIGAPLTLFFTFMLKDSEADKLNDKLKINIR